MGGSCETMCLPTTRPVIPLPPVLRVRVVLRSLGLHRELAKVEGFALLRAGDPTFPRFLLGGIDIEPSADLNGFLKQ